MIGFVVGGAVVLLAGYVIAKHHWRARDIGAHAAMDSALPDIPWHPHSMRNAPERGTDHDAGGGDAAGDGGEGGSSGGDDSD